MPQKATKGKKGAPQGKPDKKVSKKAPVQEPESDDSSEEESSSEEDVEMAPPVKNAKANAQKRKAEEESDSDDSDDSSEEETKVAQTKAKKAKVTKPPPPQEEDDDDSNDEGDSSDEEPAPKVEKGKKMEVDEDDSSDDDDDDDDDDEEEEAKPSKAVKQNGKKKEESSEEEGSSEDDSDEEEEEEKPKKKKKKESADSADETVTLFCGNLPKGMEEKKLKKLFEKKGIAIADVRKSNPKKPFGYVDLVNPADLEKALKLNGKQVGDSELKIERAESKAKEGFSPKTKKTPEKKQGGKDDSSSTLFVKNLAESVTEDSLQEIFEDAKEIRMPRKPDNSHKGFAYVVFEDESTVEEMMKEKQGTELEGMALYLDYAGKKSTFQSPGGRGGGRGGGFSGGDKRKSTGEAGKTKVLFVKNLSYSTDSDSLKEAFANATTARVATFQDNPGKSRGFGFVEFESADAAQEAFNEMKGQEIDGRQVFLDFAAERQGGGGDRHGGGRGGFRGGRGGGFRGGRGGGGFGGGRGGGFRGGRGGRGGGRGGRGGFSKSPAAKGNVQEFQGKKKTFDDSD